MPNRPQFALFIAPTGARAESGCDAALVRHDASPWEKPVLRVYGDVRELTMGTSPATGESTFPLQFRT